MGVKFLFGAETQSTTPYVSSGSGTNGVDTSLKRSGAASFFVSGAGSFLNIQSQWDSTTGLASLTSVGATHYLTIYFYIDANPGTAYTLLDFNSSGQTSGQAKIRHNADGTITLLGSAGTDLFTTTATIPLSTWFRLGVKLVSADSGSYEVNLYQDDADGSTPESHTGSGDDFKIGGDAVGWGRITIASTTSVRVNFDDGVRADGAFYPGKCELMIPNADGTYTAWRDGAQGTSPYDYTTQDEVPATVTERVHSTLGVGDANTCALESAASAGISGTVNAVLALVYDSQQDAGASFLLRYRSSSNVDSAAFTAAGARYHGAVATTKPAGGAWDTSALDALEIGCVENSGSFRTRMNAVHAEVHFTEAAAGSTVPVLDEGMLVGGFMTMSGGL